jgi:hypothetical protein
MAKMMRAAVVHAFGKPLTIEEAPDPDACAYECLQGKPPCLSTCDVRGRDPQLPLRSLSRATLLCALP